MTVIAKFTKRRSLNMSASVAQVIREEFGAGRISTLYGLEGVLRAGLRADLCLRGWSWRDANQASIDIVERAQRFVGAERPTWDEGQREWTIQAGLLIERTLCIKCHKPLPDGRHKFCSRLCGDAHQHRMANLRKGNENAVLKIAIKHVA